MYVDTDLWHPLWEETYDTNLKLWKVVSLHPAVSEVPKVGKVTALLTGLEEHWDMQNEHVTHVFSANPDGKTQSAVYNEDAAAEYNNIAKYSTSAGLMQIMR
jgi:hypothetical protein